MKLTAEQTEDLPFPIGCPVWYNFSDASGHEDETNAPILKQGVVESVTFNYVSKNLVYEVSYVDPCHPKGKIVEEVPEHDLAYGASCPVIIDSKDDGVVLLSELSPNQSGTVQYTVMIFMNGHMARYEFGIEAPRIKYRKLAKKADAQSAEASPAAADTFIARTEAPTSTVRCDPTIDREPSLASVVPTGDVEVPLSITCDSVTESGTGITEAHGKKKRDLRDVDSPLTITPMKCHRVDTARCINDSLDRQDSRRSVNSGSHESGTDYSGDDGVVMRVPKWLQTNIEAQQSIFFHLVGSKQDDRKSKRRIGDVARETNCIIRVNCPKNGSPRNNQFLITISIWPRKTSNDDRKPLNKYGHDYSRVGGPTPLSCTLNDAEINDLLRERLSCKIARDFYRADRIEYDLRAAGVICNRSLKQWRSDGLDDNWEVGEVEPLPALKYIDDAREKVQELLLDFMDIIDDAGAKGRLTYEVASSCAGGHNPRDSTSNAVGWRGPNGYGFLSLVELPFLYIDGRKSFHAHMVIQTLDNSQQVKRSGCLIKVFGGDFGVPLKYCDPYALVSGGSWQAVDAAVEIVRDVIKEHMRICRCTYSAQQQQPPLPQVSWQPPLPQVSWQPPLPQVSWQPPQQPPQLPLPPTTAIHMKLPVWIQNDCSSQRDLFSHLVGSKFGLVPKQDPMRRRNLIDIGRESNCTIAINGFNKSSLSQTPDAPIHINIKSKSSNPQDQDDAYEKVMKHLLDFMDIIDDAGAKGRLTYEVASSCAGGHNPRDSTSNAVGWRGPNGYGFLSLVELPFFYIDGRKSFHAHMVIQTLDDSQQVKRLGCLIKVFGGDFGVPLKYCDPYALVSGGSWQAVDAAVEIVRDVIKEHMRICRCTYSPQQWQNPQRPPQP